MQNAKGTGELDLSGEEKEELKNNELSKTVFYDDDIELYNLTRVFLQIPFEYSGMGGAVGKKYEAVKDFLKWNNFNVKEWTPIILQMGSVWINEVRR